MSNHPEVKCSECGGSHEPSGARSDCIRHWKRRAITAENEVNVLKNYGESYWQKVAKSRGEDVLDIEKALLSYGKIPDDCYIGTNSTADKVTWLVGRCANIEKQNVKLMDVIGDCLDCTKSINRV